MLSVRQSLALIGQEPPLGIRGVLPCNSLRDSLIAWNHTLPHFQNASVAYISSGLLDMKGLYPSLVKQRALQDQLLSENLSASKRNDLYHACSTYKLLPVVLVYLRDDDGKHATGELDSYGNVRPLKRFRGNYEDNYDYRANMISLTNDMLLASNACFGLELKKSFLLTSTRFNKLSSGEREVNEEVEAFLNGDNSILANPDPELLSKNSIVVWMSWGTDPTDPDSQGYSSGTASFIHLPAWPRNIFPAGGRIYLGTSHLAHELGHYLGALVHTFYNSGAGEFVVLDAEKAANWEFEPPFAYPPGTQKQVWMINRMVPLVGDNAALINDRNKIEDNVNAVIGSMDNFDSDLCYGIMDTPIDMTQEFFLLFGQSPFNDGTQRVDIKERSFTATDAARFNVMGYFFGNQELRRFSPQQVERMTQAITGTLPQNLPSYGADYPISRTHLAIREINPAQSPTLPYTPYQPSLMTQQEWEFMVEMFPDSVTREFVNILRQK